MLINIKDTMVRAIKEFVVPEIKTLGFSGTFPHFRREENGRFEFVSFQFNRHGGSFLLECGFVRPDDLPDFAKNLNFDKLTYGHTHPDNRLRVKPEGQSIEIPWFDYSGYKEEVQFENLAKSINPLLFKIKQFLCPNLT